jgi:hypothetical protein
MDRCSQHGTDDCMRVSCRSGWTVLDQDHASSVTAATWTLPWPNAVLAEFGPELGVDTGDGRVHS